MESDSVRRGYLKVVGDRVLGLGPTKKRWVSLREKSVRGEMRLEIFSNEKAERDGENAKQCINLATASQAGRSAEKNKHAFIVQLKVAGSVEETVFISESEADADDWVMEINRQLVRNNVMTTSNFPTTTSSQKQRSASLPVGKTKKGQKFRVNPQNQHAKLGIHPGVLCMMQVVSEKIILFDAAGKIQLAEWYLSALRRYGQTSEYIQFEAGRRCATGEGVFTMLTSDGEAIFQMIHINAEKLAKSSSSPAPARSGGTNNTAGGAAKHHRTASKTSYSQDNSSHPLNWPSSMGGSLPAGMSGLSSQNSSQSTYQALTAVADNTYAPIDSLKPKPSAAASSDTYQALTGAQNEQSLYAGVGTEATAASAARPHSTVLPSASDAQYADLSEAVPKKPEVKTEAGVVYQPLSAKKTTPPEYAAASTPATNNYMSLEEGKKANGYVALEEGTKPVVKEQTYASLSSSTQEKSVYAALGGKN